MRTKMQEQLREVLGAAAGFRPLLGHARKRLAKHDGRGAALAATVSPASSPPWRRKTNRYAEVENIAVTTYKAADGLSPADVLPKFFRTEPNVVVVRDLVDAATVEMMCEQIRRRAG